MGLLTSTSGWFPKPAALRRARWQFAEGDLDEALLHRAEIEATREAIEQQKSLGLDLPVDGQMDRADMVSFFAERIEGMEIAGWVRCFDNRYYRRPRIEGELSRNAPMSVTHWKAAQKLSDRPLKAILTGPYTLMDWSFDEHYASREKCCMALAEIVRAEAEDLLASGAAEIEIDEPAISARPDELDLAAAALGHVTANLRGKARTWTHIAYGDAVPVIERIFALPVDALMLELANSDYALLETLHDLPGDKLLGAGVIDVLSPRVESAAELDKRVESLLGVVPRERLWLVPDAGLRTLAPDVATAKLQALVAAAGRA